MNKDTLKKGVETCKNLGREALQANYDALPPGQQKQILKNETVKKFYDIFGVKY